ncbi:bifunctional methylenetetrahydrofolate dehydrogenase/cyclohydrolase 2, mitochondrial isoform X2 [Taeniopygia guttata]|uniref:bifunctional methylenetetrahydrofolate dehydrogenase/cyclohydrolase 2, mitochondrial isoform X2 n=1 Tax=Taeniopygia guttata TaxID=59729 RepID=UPI001BC8B01F|nr:probable bifunctional methylenetetrahydrofolate dehydrogenase/cyclohydrolase 2 isoform X2 [Taeniopygia guttata]
MAAATTAFSLSSASSSSAALLRPACAPLRRWRTLIRSISGSPRSAASDEATVISGTKLAHQVLKEVRRDVESWISAGNQRPHLTVILVGDNPASHIYVRNKIKAAAAVGISSEIILRPKDISQEELLDMTVKLNKDSRVSGLLVQLPLPDHIDERTVCDAIAPDKDVDGFHIVNVGRLCLDQPSIIPATAAAVWEIIKRTGIQTFGKNVLVAGRSKNVGMPIAMLLHTDGKHKRPGGIPKLITTDMVKEGAAVIDVGINHIHDPLTGKTKLVGDVDFEGYLFQAVLGTTVIPLCGPGEMENCTTALIQTENSPRVAQVGITRCKPEMKDYCFHGQCVYIVDLDEHYCRCDVGFSGVRCVHSELVRQPLSKEYVALTVIVVLLFLAALSLASYYICRRYRNKRRQTNASEYKEVGAL